MCAAIEIEKWGSVRNGGCTSGTPENMPEAGNMRIATVRIAKKVLAQIQLGLGAKFPGSSIDLKKPIIEHLPSGHDHLSSPVVDYLQSNSVDIRCMGKPSDLVQGTLDLLILRTIMLEPKHGWAIAKRIQQISNEVLQVQQGSLYPALHRLEQQGWIRAKWAESDSGRQAKFYSLTAAGRAQLEKEKESWSRLSTAINLVVEGT